MGPLFKKTAKLPAELISGNIRYPGFIDNLSDDDIYILTSPAVSEAVSTPGSLFDLKFTPPSGETYNIHCRIKWSFKTPPLGVTSIIAELTDPSGYERLAKTLQ